MLSKWNCDVIENIFQEEKKLYWLELIGGIEKSLEKKHNPFLAYLELITLASDISFLIPLLFPSINDLDLVHLQINEKRALRK